MADEKDPCLKADTKTDKDGSEQEIDKETVVTDETNEQQEDMSQLLQSIMEALSLDTASGTKQELLPHISQLQSLLRKVILLLKEKCRLCANLERQNNALEQQAKSLKDVVAITKDLLSIRNNEVVHLHVDIQTLEEKINFERERHNLMLSRMTDAIKLNENLKDEYQAQLGLFTDLRARYEEKVAVLEKENKRLADLVKSNADNVN